MKKGIYKIVLVLLAVVIAATFCGCTFRDYLNSGNGNNNSAYKQIDDGKYEDSVESAENVSIVVADESSRTKLPLEEAVMKVERTSVMLTTDNNSAGSGVIVNISFIDDGTAWKTDENMVYILTCHHMVEDLGEIVVTIPDETCSYDNADYMFSGKIGAEEPSVYESQGYAVTLVGGDAKSDIALLKLNLAIPAKSQKTLTKDKIVMAEIPPKEGYAVRKGETVFSVGNPTGSLPGSVARGVISYIERQTSVSEIGDMTLMQIDVSTNPGSSGGGLYNLYGELIGITNAGNTNYTNINFAIPCYLSNGNGFVEIAEQLGGTATDANYGYISGRREMFGFTVNGTSGMPVVESVDGTGQAYACGLRERDVIIKVVKNGETYEIEKYEDLTAVLDGIKIGDVLNLTVSRQQKVGGFWNSSTEEVEVTLNPLYVRQIRFCDTGK